MTSRLTRRQFAQLVATAAPAAALGFEAWPTFAADTPKSVIAGVTVGVISGSFQGLNADQIIPSMLKLGLSEVELQSTHAEALAGAPAPAAGRRGGGAAPEPPALNADGLLPRCANLTMIVTPPLSAEAGQRARGAATPEQEIARQRLREWRAATTPATWQAVRRQFTDAGIDLRSMFYSLGFQGAPTSDEEIDYAFRMAQGLGLRAISGSSTIPIARRIAVAADKYKILWAGHTQDNVNDPDQFVSPDAYNRLLALSPYFRINLDIGYFTAAGHDPVAFIQKNHARITNIHLKDKKRSAALGGPVSNNALNNFPWGQGDTPIREVLQLLKREKYDIPVQIEYEYGCRTTGDPVTEIARCYDYVKKCLA